MPRLIRVQADSGEEFFGDVSNINDLPEEFSKPLKTQLAAFAEGKKVDPVSVPRIMLEKAGFSEKETVPEADLGESLSMEEKISRATGVDEEIQPHAVDRIRNDMERTIGRPMRPGSCGSYNKCEDCPLREVAIKALDKVLEKI